MKKKVEEPRKKKKSTKSKKKNKEITFNLFEMIVIVIVAILFGGVLGGLSFSTKSISTDKNIQLFNNTYNDLVKEYYKKVDKEKLVNAAIEGMVNYLGDPYSIYMNSEQTEDFNTTVNGEYEGIGVTVSLIDDMPTVVSIFDNSPASKAGIEVKDIILKVNNKSVKGKKLDDVVKMIKKQSNVTLLIERDGKTREFNLKLSNVVLPSVETKIFDDEIGYIHVSVFSANTYKQFKLELEKLEEKDIKSLIIDVRDNPGGHLDQVTKILELFMDNKNILYQIKSGKQITKVKSTSTIKREYPIVVLTNGNSASASEILAGAIKESYKGQIVGTKTYGKGTVQKEKELENGTSIKYTTEEWLTPLGNNIHKKGITPTIEEKLSDDYKEDPSEENDNQLQRAIEELQK